MPASLDSIVAATRQRLSLTRRKFQPAGPGTRGGCAHPRGFRNQLRRVAQDGHCGNRRTEKSLAFKRPDPRANSNPLNSLPELERAGAAALSVLTDEQFFQGSLDYLRQASSSSSLPCLRKDFIVDEFQIVEARANCADAILLIVAALDQKELISLAKIARSHGLDVLCEAHDEPELQRALDAGCDLIGVNSRNLHTFEVDLETAFRLAEKIPAACVRVAESGIQSGADLARLRSAGYEAFLIGESLMKAEQPRRSTGKVDRGSKSSSRRQ